MRYFSILQLCLLFFLPACQSGGGNADDCTSSPQAIFSKDTEGVENQDFIRTGKDGLEVVSFSNGTFLEIHQTGCDSLRQEFRFRLPAPPAEDSPEAWLAEAQGQFRFLGALGPEYAPFTDWANALSESADGFKLGQPMEVAQGFWMQVDEVDSFDGPTLVVVCANFEL